MLNVSCVSQLSHQRSRQCLFPDESHHLDVVQALWLGELLEKLSNVLQHLDEMGCCVPAALKEDGPILAAERTLFEQATSSPEAFFPVSVLIHHFEVSSTFDPLQFERDCFAKALSMAAQLWARVTRVLFETPWSLLAASYNKDTEALEKIANLPDCELDATCSRVIIAEDSSKTWKPLPFTTSFFPSFETPPPHPSRKPTLCRQPAATFEAGGQLCPYQVRFVL